MSRSIALLRGEHTPILTILLLSAVLGLVITTGYGVSWDEFGDFKYGEDSLKAYVAPEKLVSHGDRDDYGPFYLMVASVSADLFRDLRPGWVTADGRHFSNFLTFLAGVFFFYLLATRYVKPVAAFGATLLLGVQPILFGHGFVNQKDIPFMAFFTASVTVGLIAVDAWAGERGNDQSRGRFVSESGTGGTWRSLTNDWRLASSWSKAVFILLIVAAGVIAFDLFRGLVILPWIQASVTSAYQDQAWGPINRAFRLVAQDYAKTPLSLYLDKAVTALLWLRVPVSLIVFIPGVATGRRLFARTIDAQGAVWYRSRLSLVGAAALLGFCTSIRVAGPLAGAIVSLAFMARLRRKSAGPILAYWILAGLIVLATWPSLWQAPLPRLWRSLGVMTNFPGHSVLYDGQVYSSRSLPWHYLPALFGLQLTEPAVFLGLVGLTLGGVSLVRRPERRTEISLIGIWIGVPAAAVMLLHRPIYNNIRQLLFIFPAVFILVAIGVEQVLEILKGKALKGTAIGLALIPGVLAIMQLHPYETIYYNSLIGGVDGAVGRYELDPWCTSYREAAEFINQIAPVGAYVAVWGPDNAGVATFARDDLILISAERDDILPDFAVGCMDGTLNPGFFPQLDGILEIHRGKAVLAVVKH